MPVEPGPPRNPLRLRSLGYPALCDDGGEVRAIERKALGLLVFLGASAAPVSREAAATLLWPEADPEASRARLRRLLHKIAAATGVRAVLADRLSLRLDRAHAPESDARAFEAAADAGALDRAAGLYVGDFLAGFHLPDCPEFEEWALYRREALRGRFIQVLERLIEHASEDFDAEAKLRHANRLVALDPLNETAHRHVIAAHLAAGNTAAAARQLALCARLLHDELGVEPEPATLALLSLPAAPAVASLPRTRYVAVDGVHVAWQTVGDGPVDIVVVPGFVSHLDRMWEDARCRAWLEAAARIGRLILFDRRGVGLSDRGVAEPSIEATARDIGAVMDAAGSRRAVLVGRLSEPRSLSSAPSSAAHQGRRSLGGSVRLGDLAVHLEDDFAGDRISDAKVTAQVFQHLATVIEGFDHLRPGRDDRVHAVPLADEAEFVLAGLDDGNRAHSSEGVAVYGAVRLDIVRVSTRLHPHAHPVVGCHGSTSPEVSSGVGTWPNRQLQVPTSTCPAIRPAWGWYTFAGVASRATH